MRKLNELRFDNSFARLPEAFYSCVTPTPLPSPYLVAFSHSAAELLDVDPQQFRSEMAARAFIGAELLPGSEPLAALYAGHQFGHYVPQLGDGRAILLGEVVGRQGQSWELQLKGAGLTPYSRDGDGRAVLRSSIREFLCSEAMAALGIPTTRALCLYGSDEEVYRERIETAAVVTRMAPSFVRFGSFEVFFYRNQYHRLGELAEHVIERHYPHLQGRPERYAELLGEVVQRTARLIAQWQLVGFAHGVLNTDNMSILGLTLDYGPFGFLDRYDPGFICNHSDYQGRYAFDRQPSIGLWNLTCLAQAMLPLLDENGEAAAARAQAILQRYETALVAAYADGMRAKLGLLEAGDDDQQLSASLLGLMEQQQADYTLTFRNLAGLQRAGGDAAAIRDLFVERAAFDRWAADYRARLAQEAREDAQRQAAMRAVNPRFVLRNYLAQEAIEAAENQDFTVLEQLAGVLARPFDEQPEAARFASLPPAWADEIAVSCSS